MKKDTFDFNKYIKNNRLLKEAARRKPSNPNSKLDYMIGAYRGGPIPQESMGEYSPEDIAEYKKLAPKLRNILTKYQLVINDPIYVRWKKADDWLSGRSGY
jgi:hypothetical protein